MNASPSTPQSPSTRSSEPPRLILGIETSCDETGVALYHAQQGLLAEALHSQVALHAAHGGVVPELASRDHVRRLPALVTRVLDQAGVAGPQVEGIAYTAGPGLVGALMVGACYAQGLGLAWDRPTLGVHHMEGHLLAPLLESGEEPAEPPFLALLVSGGHTMLVDVPAIGRYQLLGESLDDAAGEAFDKAAKIMGLGYPGGPALAALAEDGDPEAFALPRPMLSKPGLDFSFSGLKTALLLAHREAAGDGELSGQRAADLAASFQAAVVDTLVAKVLRALEVSGRQRCVIAGGVSANRRLRDQLGAATAERGVALHLPAPAFCTDNGAMIALAGARRMAAGERDQGPPVVRARWPLSELPPVPEAT